MIASLAKAARVLDNEKYKSSATKAMDFILTKMRKPNGRLLHRYRDGDFSIDATLDDYAFVIWSLLELYETTFELKYLQSAIEFQDIQNKYFWDSKNYGYFLTASDAEKLLTRSKDIYDGAIPSGNSVSFNNLLKLSRLTSNNEYENLASKLSKSFSDIINKAPTGTTMMLSGVDFALGGSSEIIIVSDKKNQEGTDLIKQLNQVFIPNKVIVLKTQDNAKELEKIAPFTKDYKIEPGKTVVYVCKNYKCNLPTSDIKTVFELLDYNQ